jgi:hypothetical protein
MGSTSRTKAFAFRPLQKRLSDLIHVAIESNTVFDALGLAKLRFARADRYRREDRVILEVLVFTPFLKE